MSVKQFNNVRLNLKHDTEQNWLLTSFVPNKGEAIVYDKDDNYAYPRLKIGDGETNVNDLPFISGGVGVNVAGKTFTINETEVTAEEAAEIFNDYVNNIATGVQSHAEGRMTKAVSRQAHAEGDSTLAGNGTRDVSQISPLDAYGIGAAAHAEGIASFAKGGAAHAEGYKTQALGSSSHAEGESTQALERAAHAEGRDTVASGTTSHAEGLESQATNGSAHAEGYNTRASGDCSHSEGNNTVAGGASSHAEGFGTKASSNYQHAQGKWNVEDTENKYAHIIGNGTDDNNRSNAHTVDWDGNAWYSGKVFIGGTSPEDAVELGAQAQSDWNDEDEASPSYIKNKDKIATKEYVNEHINNDVVHWSINDRSILSNATSENCVNSNNATLLTDAGNSPIKNLIVTTKEKTDKVYLTICGKNIAEIKAKKDIQRSSTLPVVLPSTLGDTTSSIDLNIDEKSFSPYENIVVPKEKLYVSINDGFKFSMQLFKNGEFVVQYNLISDVSFNNTDEWFDEVSVLFDSEDIDNIKFMIEIGNIPTSYEPYKGYTVVYKPETSIPVNEVVDLSYELENFNTYHGVTNVISNCNVSFDYNQLKETSTSGYLYSAGGKVVTTLATDYENGLMSKEDKKKLNGFEVATDEDVFEMLSSIGLIEDGINILTNEQGYSLADEQFNILTN